MAAIFYVCSLAVLCICSLRHLIEKPRPFLSIAGNYQRDRSLVGYANTTMFLPCFCFFRTRKVQLQKRQSSCLQWLASRKVRVESGISMTARLLLPQPCSTINYSPNTTKKCLMYYIFGVSKYSLSKRVFASINNVWATSSRRL